MTADDMSLCIAMEHAPPRAMVTMDEDVGTTALPPLEVLLYRCGILWSSEDVPGVTNLSGMRLCVNVTTTTTTEASSFARTRDGDVDWVPSLPSELDPPGATVLAQYLLRAEDAAEWSKSRLVRALLARAHPWRSLLREQWRSDHAADPKQVLVNAMRDPHVCDEMLALMDVRMLMAHVAPDANLDLTGHSILRRMEPSGFSRSVEWRASSVAEHAVATFVKIPVTAQRLETLHRLGATETLEWPCAFGFLSGEGDKRSMVLPMDACATTVEKAILSLLCGERPLQRDGALLPRIVLDFTSPNHEGAPSVHSTETLVPYRVELKERDGRLELLRDAKSSARLASESLSVDTTPTDMSRGDERIDHGRLGHMFPNLLRRLDMQSSLEGVFREARSRRVVSEWHLEAIESCDNLSSLGLSVLVALALQLWSGARTRVYLSRTRAAVCAYWSSVRNDFVLVDPARSLQNAFKLAPSLIHLPESGSTVALKRNDFVQIFVRHKWHTARVLDTFPLIEEAHVQFLISGARQKIGMHERGRWRHPVSSDHSDLEDVLRRRVLVGSASSSAEQAAPPSSTMPLPAVMDTGVSLGMWGEESSW